MTIDTTLLGRDLYLRTTDETGRLTYSHHRVWDAARFMTARVTEAAELNRTTASNRAHAERITREQFDTRSDA